MTTILTIAATGLTIVFMLRGITWDRDYNRTPDEGDRGEPNPAKELRLSPQPSNSCDRVTLILKSVTRR